MKEGQDSHICFLHKTKISKAGMLWRAEEGDGSDFEAVLQPLSEGFFPRDPKRKAWLKGSARTKPGSRHVLHYC